MNRAAGFTLLEALVATSILALLMTVLTGGMRFGLRAWEAGERQVDRVEGAAAAQTLLRRAIEQAYPLVRRKGEPVVVLEGEPRRLRFVTALPDRAGVAGLADVTLRFTDDGALVMAWQALGERERPAAERTLLDGVAAGTFSYYGGAARHEPADWRTDWREAGFPPALVRLDIRFHDGRPWPDFAVAPALTVDSLLD